MFKMAVLALNNSLSVIAYHRTVYLRHLSLFLQQQQLLLMAPDVLSGPSGLGSILKD